MRYFTLQITENIVKKERDNVIESPKGVEKYIGATLSSKIVVAKKSNDFMFSFNINIIDKNALRFDDFDRKRLLSSAKLNNASLYNFLENYFLKNSCDETKNIDSNIILISNILIENENSKLILETIESTLKDMNADLKCIFIEQNQLDLDILTSYNYFVCLNENFVYKRFI